MIALHISFIELIKYAVHDKEVSNWRVPLFLKSYNCFNNVEKIDMNFRYYIAIDLSGYRYRYYLAVPKNVSKSFNLSGSLVKGIH